MILTNAILLSQTVNAYNLYHIPLIMHLVDISQMTGSTSSGFSFYNYQFISDRANIS